MNLLAEMDWSPGMHDPSLLGWVNTVFYFAVAALSAYIYWRARISRAEAFHRRFWLITTLTMAILGINKAFDLQSLVTEIGRLIFGEEGRRPRQAAAIVVVLLLAGILAPLLGRRLLRRETAVVLAFIGKAYLVTFVIVRGISLHQVDSILYHTSLGPLVNATIEFTGIAIVAAGALLALRPPARTRYQAFERTVRIN